MIAQKSLKTRKKLLSDEEPNQGLFGRCRIKTEKRLTGFPGGGAAAAAVKGISFPLEMEEAVDIWAVGAAAGAEASEAAGFGRTVLDLAFLDGGSKKPSSLRK
jgi:hypothetical protein